MAFDPDAYLATKEGPAAAAGFDPDAYLAANAPASGPSASSWDNFTSGLKNGAMRVGAHLHDLLGANVNPGLKVGAPAGAYDPISKERWNALNQQSEEIRNTRFPWQSKDSVPVGASNVSIPTGGPVSDAYAQAKNPGQQIGPGQIGQFFGEAAATAPAALIAGAPAKALLGSGAGSPLLQRAAIAGLTGAAEGATAGALTAQRPEDRARGALAGLVAGGGIGSAFPVAGAFLRSRADAAAAQVAKAAAAAPAASQAVVAATPPAASRGIVGTILREPPPIPEAQYLQSRGVRLTKGLLDPTSSYGQVELASTSKGGVGPLIAKQRHQALADAMGVAMEDAAPPGARLKFSGGINERYQTLKGAWDSAYDAIRAKGEQIYPAIHDGQGGQALRSTANRPGVLDDIINDQNEIWDDASREQAKRFIDNQLTRLPESKGAVGKVDLGDMLKVRSNIVKAKGSAIKSQKYDLAQILDRAGDAIDQAVESQASPETSSALQALNAKYRDFKVVEDAVVRSGDSPGGLLPSRLASAVKAGESSRSRYAAGGGGPLRQLSQSISKVFDESAAPPTGARILSAMPGWLNDTLVAPTMYLRNGARQAPPASMTAGPISAAAKRQFLLGAGADLLSSETSPQAAALLAALRARNSPPLGLVPAVADDPAAGP